MRGLTVWWSVGRVRQRGDQQREPDGEPERGGGQRAGEPDHCPGTSASFSVSATGTGLSYQWYKGGNALAGQTGSSLV